MNQEKALVWFRRDLRDHDHAALSAALSNAREVHCAFIFDTDILDALPSRDGPTRAFHPRIAGRTRCRPARPGGGLIVRHGRASEEIPNLARELGVASVYANRDYEPAAKARDAAVAENLQALGIAFHTRKDQAIFDGDEVLTQAGKPFSVFTPTRMPG